MSASKYDSMWLWVSFVCRITIGEGCAERENVERRREKRRREKRRRKN